MCQIRRQQSFSPFKPCVFLGDMANSGDPDQMPHNVASDQFVYRTFYLNLNTNEKYHPTTLKLEMNLSN